MQVNGRAVYVDAVDHNCEIFTKCNFTCDVSVPDNFRKSIVFPPVVFWERRTHDGRWLDLGDKFWLKTYGIYYNSHVEGICKLMNDDSYRCEYMLPFCCSPLFDGTYRCKLTVRLMRLITFAEEFQLSKCKGILGEEVRE